MLLEPPDVQHRSPPKLAPWRPVPRAGLGQPATRSLKVVARFLGVDQAARHAARSAAASGWRRQLVISADAVDPGINVIGVDIEAGGEGGFGRGDARGFPGEASLPLGLGFRAGSIGAIAWARGSVHASNVVLVAGNRQHGAIGRRPEAPRERQACAREATQERHGKVSHMDQCTAGDFRAATGALTCPSSPGSPAQQHHGCIGPYGSPSSCAGLAEVWRQPCVTLAVRFGALGQGPAGVSRLFPPVARRPAPVARVSPVPTSLRRGRPPSPAARASAMDTLALGWVAVWTC